MSHEREHPLSREVRNEYLKGRMSRRDFLRYAALLGVSFTSARALTGGLTRTTHAASHVVRGGTMRIGSQVMRAVHPAQYSWVAPSNVLRNVLEYLTYTDKDNITHPYLLESWQPSDDLKTWTLNLRRGIRWSNGDPFNADDVVFSMKQWLDPDVGSSMKSLLGYLQSDNIEKVDAYTVRLHLDSPQLAVPEHLFHYPAQILNHRTFEGDILKAPVGTGPFQLEEYVEGERAVLRRRSGYWKQGVDGEALPYLDELIYVDLGDEMSAYVSAFQSGSIDRIDFGDLPDLDAYLALRNHPDAKIDPVTTSQTRVLRMRVDKEPWTDNRVRRALTLCQNREKIVGLAYYGEAGIGEDFHVAPVHPAYAAVGTPKYDPERARQLLAEAGYPNGLTVDLTVGSGWPDVVSYAEVLKQDAAPAGLIINVKPVPTSVYWDQWTEVDLGITPWTHRPLATMVLRLAYTADDQGNPVAWNETRWVDDEFQSLLSEAERTVDVDARRKLVGQMERIQQERGSVGIAYWRNAFSISRKGFENVSGHPTNYYYYDEVWKNPNA